MKPDDWNFIGALILGGGLAMLGVPAAAIRWSLHWKAYCSSVRHYTASFELPDGSPHAYALRALDAEDVIVRLKHTLGEHWPEDGQLRNLEIQEGDLL